MLHQLSAPIPMPKLEPRDIFDPAENRHRDQSKVKDTDEFQTPPWLFSQLANRFKFQVDIAARQKNCLAKYYCVDFLRYGLEGFDEPQVCFCNPPYSRTEEWVRQCYQESLGGHTIVMLIPASTDTSYWHEIIFKKAKEIWFLKKRINFWMNNKPYAIDGRPSSGKDAIAVVIFQEPKPTIHHHGFVSLMMERFEELFHVERLPREPVIKAVDLSPQSKLPF